ncbi:MAG: DUF3617 family protein [Gammaproteobacteria bacterium]|nr:DUF3617 family protein [Gammaproteobacteria bacterium]
MNTAQSRLTTSLLAMIVTFAISNLAWGDTKPKGGLYDIVVNIENSALPVPRTTSSQECITKGEFELGPNEFLDEQQPQQDCAMIEYSYENGEITMNMECVIPEAGKVVILGSGSYTATGFEMTNKMKMSISGMDMQMTTTAKGTRIGDCKT